MYITKDNEQLLLFPAFIPSIHLYIYIYKHSHMNIGSVIGKERGISLLVFFHVQST